MIRFLGNFIIEHGVPSTIYILLTRVECTRSKMPVTRYSEPFGKRM